ncbi:MAG: tetratricopeptide repeat protein, partial [Phycisphaerales bacterium]|nr:tetratricopeptide repeat protein [Phycisphaerales bacterium]
MNVPDDTEASLLRTLCLATATERRALLAQQDDPAETLTALIQRTAELSAQDPDRAIPAAELCVDLADDLDRPDLKSSSRRALARAFAYASRYDDSLQAARSAIGIADHAGDGMESGRARLTAMHALTELGRLDDAIASGNDARERFERLGEPTFAARADINLGFVHQRRDDPVRALACLDRAAECIRHDPLLYGHLQNHRGVALLDLNRFTDADAAYADAYDAFEQGHADLPAAIALSNRADLAARQGQLQRSLHWFESARARLERLNAPGHLARLLAEQADMQRLLGMPERAIAHYRQAIGQLDELGLILEATRARAGCGLAQVRIGALGEAETSLAAATRGFEELHNVRERGRIDLTRAELASVRGRMDEARRLLHTALSALHDSPSDVARGRLLSAHLARVAGRLDEAHADTTVALGIARELDLAPLLADALHQRGMIASAQGDLDGARSSLREALQEIERLRGALHSERFRSAFAAHQSSIYDDFLDVLLDSGRAEDCLEAFAVSQHAKNRALLERAPGRAQRMGTGHGPAEHQALRTQYDEARGVLNGLFVRLTDFDRARPDDAVLATWRRDVRAAEARLADLEDRLAASDEAWRVLGHPMSMESVQRTLSEGTAHIEYVLTEHQLITFVITATQHRTIVQLCARSAWQERADAVQFDMQRAIAAYGTPRLDRLTRGMTSTMQEFWDLLLEPIADLINTVEHISIAPHGPLFGLPFAAMERDGLALIDRVAITVVPSASIAAGVHHADATVIDGAPLLIGVANELAPGIRREVMTVRDVLASHHPIVLQDDAADVRSVTHAMQRSSHIHCACHGRYDADDPQGSGLQLADRWMTVRDLAELDLNADT